MILLKLLLTGGLIFLTAMAFSTDECILLNYIIPEHYNVKFKQYIIPYENNTYYVEYNVNINILQATQSINFNILKTQRIINIELIDNPPRFRKNEIIIYKPIKHVHDNKTQIIEFFFTVLPSGRYTLDMKFTDTIADNGNFRTLYSMEGENVAWIAPTHFYTFGARSLFSCWYKPELRATFNISVLHTQNATVISNMPAYKYDPIGNFTLWTHFLTTPAISADLIIVVVIPTQLFYVISNTENSAICYRRNVSTDLSYAKEVIKHVTLNLESEWKRSEKYTKVNHIAIPNLQVKAMVTFGLVLYRESDILYHADSNSIARKIEVGHLLGRKIVQEWFFNMFHPASWLNDVLIPFLGINIIDKARPNDRMMDLFVVQVQREYLHLDADYSIWPLISQTSNSIKNPFYKKALFSLRMLQYQLPENVFWDSVRTYLHSNESSYKVFQETIIAEYGDRVNYQNVTVNGTYLLPKMIETMDVWATHKCYPFIDVNADYFRKHNYFIINIRANFSGFYMPLTFTTQSRNDFKDTFPFYWLTKKNPSLILTLPEDSWIIFNIQQIGYYRVNYDLFHWIIIWSELKSENYTKIHVLNRAQIIDDAFHFMIARKLDSFMFWQLATYLKQEEDYVAWYPMFKALEYMSRVFPLEDQKVNDVKKKMRDILDELLEKLKYDEDLPNEHDLRKCLREEAVKWACLFDSATCHYKAKRTLQQHLEKPGLYKLLPWWKTWTYCNGLKKNKKRLYDNITSTWMTMLDMLDVCYEKFLKFLPCSQNSNNIKNYLHLIKDAQSTLCNNTQIQLNPQVERNLINYFLVTIAKHATNNDTLIYILENFRVIRLRQINAIAALTVIINNIYSIKQLDNLNEVITNMFKKTEVTNDIIDMTFLRNKHLEKNTTQRMQRIIQTIIGQKIKIRKTEVSHLSTYLNFLQLEYKKH